MSAKEPAQPATSQEEQARGRDKHDRETQEREAYEYWGYLFKADKTGTDKFKSLLRGLKEIINKQFDSANAHGASSIDRQSDLTPDQLAHFYRELHGNYDQLFLGTPNESIAFIYKSLGCLHSLQPQNFSHGTAFTDPTVPALKTEGWIMWQTIQLLLGPDEHSQFMMEAVQKWDVKDPVTGQSFPKILPRRCFPMEPDKHMVDWYEGVSERLKREAEEEERMREIEAEKAEVRRLRSKAAAEAEDGQKATDDEGSVDSRGPALAYFRNPLYRHVDGRPSILRKNSKRPALSPKPTSIVNRGKEAAISAGNVILNIGSPHLWDGGSRHSSRERPDRDVRDRRRRSLPDQRQAHHHPTEPTAAAGAHETVAGGLSPHDQRHRRRRSLQHAEQPPVPPDSGDDEWDADESSMYNSPRPTPPHHHHHHQARPSSTKHDARDSHLRHSRSHEPTPSQREYDDYFQGYDDPSRRRNSAYEPPSTETPPAQEGNDSGGGFGPSASPLFATHVAHVPQPRRPQPPQPSNDPPRPPPFHTDPYGSQPPSGGPLNPRRPAPGRPYSSSPAARRRPAPDRADLDDGGIGARRRYDDPSWRTRFEQSPAGYDYGDNDGPEYRDNRRQGPQGPLHADGRRPPSRSFDMPPHIAYHTPPPPPGGPGGGPGGGRRPGGRNSLGDTDVYSAYDDGRRQGRPKMTRFESGEGGRPGSGPGWSGNDSREREEGGNSPSGRPPRRSISRGVDGRRYVDESPWSR